MVDVVGFGFAVYDSSGRFIYVNRRYAALFGVKQTTLEGMGIGEVNPEFEKERFDEYWESFSDGETRTRETTHSVDGTTVPLEVRSTCQSIDGERFHFGAIQDITERNAREQKLQQYLEAVEAAGHVIFLTDPDGTIRYVNPAFEEITGYGKEEALGATPNLLNSGEMSDEYWVEFWETILAGEQWEELVINQRKSGEFYHANQTVSPVVGQDGEIQAFVAVQDELTDRIEAERTIRTLDHLLRHNLRNRLNVIMARAEKIAAGENRQDDLHCERILESARALAVTADKGHELVEFLSESTYRQQIDVSEVSRRLVDAFQSQYSGVQFSVESPPRACAFAVERLNRGLEEILANAVEHNDPAGLAVDVTVRKDSETVRVEIRDTGSPIPEMERQVLRGEKNIDQLYHGSGLGLSLVYWIVRRSGGTISVSENDAGGNTISITLERPAATHSNDARGVPGQMK